LEKDNSGRPCAQAKYRGCVRSKNVKIFWGGVRGGKEKKGAGVAGGRDNGGPLATKYCTIEEGSNL